MRRKTSALLLLTALGGALFGVGLPAASAAPATPATATVHAVSAARSASTLRAPAPAARAAAPVDAAGAKLPRPATSTEVHFKNYTESTVYVSIVFYDPNVCKFNGEVGTAGWYAVPPQTGDVLVLHTTAPWVEFYAYDVDGHVWDGTIGTPGANMLVNPQSAFRSCLTTQHPGWKLVSTRLVTWPSGITSETIELYVP